MDTIIPPLLLWWGRHTSRAFPRLTLDLRRAAEWRWNAGAPVCTEYSIRAGV